MASLKEVLDRNVREGDLYENMDRGFVRCFACGHRCRIPDGQPGVCKVRFNRGGRLYVPWGYVGGVQCVLNLLRVENRFVTSKGSVELTQIFSAVVRILGANFALHTRERVQLGGAATRSEIGG